MKARELEERIAELSTVKVCVAFYSFLFFIYKLDEPKKNWTVCRIL